MFPTFCVFALGRTVSEETGPGRNSRRPAVQNDNFQRRQVVPGNEWPSSSAAYQNSEKSVLEDKNSWRTILLWFFLADCRFPGMRPFPVMHEENFGI
jgi:hypothetical protein